MPPKAKFTKQEIINAALELTRERGFEGVTARAVGARLGASSKIVFGAYKSMEELQADVILAAKQLYNEYLSCEMSGDRYPKYKASGIGYIRFAKEQRELFKLLFMRDRSNEVVADEREELKPIISIICRNTGLSETSAYMLHIELWIYVHGIATMIATSYLDWDWDTISQMMTDAYESLKERYIAKELSNGSDKNSKSDKAL